MRDAFKALPPSSTLVWIKVPIGSIQAFSMKARRLLGVLVFVKHGRRHRRCNGNGLGGIPVAGPIKYHQQGTQTVFGRGKERPQGSKK